MTETRGGKGEASVTLRGTSSEQKGGRGDGEKRGRWRGWRTSGKWGRRRGETPEGCGPVHCRHLRPVPSTALWLEGRPRARLGWPGEAGRSTAPSRPTGCAGRLGARRPGSLTPQPHGTGLQRRAWDRSVAGGGPRGAAAIDQPALPGDSASSAPRAGRPVSASDWRARRPAGLAAIRAERVNGPSWSPSMSEALFTGPAPRSRRPGPHYATPRPPPPPQRGTGPQAPPLQTAEGAHLPRAAEKRGGGRAPNSVWASTSPSWARGPDVSRALPLALRGCN